MRKFALCAPIAVATMLVQAFGLNVAHANIGETYGFGSKAAALGGMGAATNFDSFASYSNPAGLSLVTGEAQKFSVSLGLLLMEHNFTPISNVVIENDYISDKTTPVYGNIDNNYRTTFGQLLGVTYRVTDWKRLTIGLTTFLPVNHVAYVDTGETFHPEYVLYRSRSQRPIVEVGAGMDLSDSLHVGLGVHVGFSLTGNATLFLNSDANKPSTFRFLASVQPKASPNLAVLWTPSSRFSVGSVLRFPLSSDNTLVLNTGARLVGQLVALDFIFNAISTMFYDPLTVELGTSWEHSPHWRLIAQLDYQAWSSFKMPALLIQDPNVTGCTGASCGVAISPGQIPSFPFRDLVIPRIGEELTVGSTVYRVSYGYRASFMSALPTGAGNYLDPPKHMIQAGVGFKTDKFLGAPIPASVDFHAALHLLETQHITKTVGDERGVGTGNAKIGAPGYDAGGKIWGGGVSLSLAI